jgi:hypothetical protein
MWPLPAQCDSRPGEVRLATRTARAVEPVSCSKMLYWSVLALGAVM